MQTIDAIFENGVFRPLSPLQLPENAKVRLSIADEHAPQQPLPDWPRSVPTGLELADPDIDRAAVLAAMSKISESVVDELRREREGRLECPPTISRRAPS